MNNIDAFSPFEREILREVFLNAPKSKKAIVQSLKSHASIMDAMITLNRLIRLGYIRQESDGRYRKTHWSSTQ